MRRAQVILLCEDKQQEVFVRRVIRKLRGKDVVRTVPMPCGRGSGEPFVRDHFPSELRAQRMKAVTSVLVVVIDGDKIGIDGRRRQLDEACTAADVNPRRDGDRVLIAIPTRNIETWLSYLAGEDTTETDTYRRLPRPGDCRPHIDALGARGETPTTFERRCIPPERRCSSVAYGQYTPSSRLVRRAPHRSRCYAGFHHGLLVAMCHTNRLRAPAPSSLEAACADYRDAFRAR